MGLSLPPTAERYERLEETLRLAAQMWAGDAAPFHGVHYQLEHPVSSPPTLSQPRPPILIGGMGERKTLRLVAQYADACNLFDIPDGGATIRRKLDVLARHCDDLGRDCDSVEKTLSSRLESGESAERFAARCATLAALGIDHVVLVSTVTLDARSARRAVRGSSHARRARMMLATQTLYDWLLFLHVLAAMVWVGGGVMLAVIAGRVLRDPDPAAVGRFTGSLRVLGPLVLAPATLAVLGLGIGLVVDTDVWDFGQLWLQLGLGLFAAAFLVGVAWQSRTALAATRAAGRDDDAEARRQLRRWAWGYRLIVLLLIVAAWDMTTKPGL